MAGSSSTSQWTRVGVVVGAYVTLWIAWRAGMGVLHEGFTYLVILFATVVCGALLRHWSVVLLGLVPVLVFLGEGAPDGVSAPSQLLDFFTPIVASCAVIGAEIGRRLVSAERPRDLQRPLHR
jgi:hypothetical protein